MLPVMEKRRGMIAPRFIPKRLEHMLILTRVHNHQKYKTAPPVMRSETLQLGNRWRMQLLMHVHHHPRSMAPAREHSSKDSLKRPRCWSAHRMSYVKRSSASIINSGV